MKVAILTSGLLPLPAVKGGAIETLLDSFVNEHEKQESNNIKFEIYSVYNKHVKNIAKQYKNTQYIYLNNIGNFTIRLINKILKRNIPINYFYQKRLIKAVLKEKYDYIILENYPELVMDLKQFKVITYIHSDVFNKDIKNCKEILANCYKVITVSDYIKNRVLEIDKTKGEKVITIYNSIDLDNIPNSKKVEYRNEIRKKYNINKNDFVYAYSGRISKEKGVLELVQAFNKINIENKKLLIIGGIWYGSNKKNNYLLELENISNKNVIYTGYINHKDIEKILCAVDVGVVPSICNEAAGLSVVEFMNTGSIVVTSNKGGIPEYLNKADNYIADYDDKFVNNLTLAMEQCYKDKDNFKEKQKGNFEFSKKFSIQENYKQIIKVLESSDIK